MKSCRELPVCNRLNSAISDAVSMGRERPVHPVYNISMDGSSVLTTNV